MNYLSKTKKFIEKAIKIHGDKYDYSSVNYLTSKTKIKIICPIHGEFEQTPHDHLGNHGCSNCGGTKKLNNKTFIEKAIKIHGNKYDYSLVRYVNNTFKIKIKCVEHGVFEQTPNNHLGGYGCSKCGLMVIKTKLFLSKEDFIKKAIKIHGNKYDYSLSDYQGCYGKIKIICHKHGEFLQQASSHILGRGCPICKESHGEREVRLYLIKNNFNFIQRKTFTECRDKYPLPFDFYLPEHNTCIEFDGRQHFESIEKWGGNVSLSGIKHRDMIKTKYCAENNIFLLRITFKESVYDKLTNHFNTK